VRDFNYWVDDGNIAVIVCGVAFRVYRGLLETHSPAFQELFQGASVVHPYAVLLGCPVVFVTDTPLAFRAVLKHYWVGPQVNNMFPSNVELIYYQVLMGRKYALPDLLESACERLEDIFPQDLRTFTQIDGIPPARRLACSQDALLAIILARELDRPALLPSAFLVVAAEMRPAALLAGAVLADGTRAHLAPADRAACLDLHARLVRERVNLVRRVFAPEHFADCARAACARGAEMFLTRFVAAFPSAATPRPFWWWSRELVGMLEEPFRPCAACTEAFEDRQRVEMDDLWASLPCIIGIEVPGW
ncbi:hypothetical protein C8Q79DRAFT_871111, partial [Trametes meyenii]